MIRQALVLQFPTLRETEMTDKNSNYKEIKLFLESSHELYRYLQQFACENGGFIKEESVNTIILSRYQGQQTTDYKMQVLFDEMVGGCSCGDGNFSLPGQCEVIMRISHNTCSAVLEILD